MMNIRIHKVAAVIIGVAVLLALGAGATLLVTNHINAHNLAVQRAVATAGHNRAMARASAAANAKAIAAANAKAAKAEAVAKAARAAAKSPAPASAAVTSPPQQAPAEAAPQQQPPANAAAVVTQYYQDLSNGDYADAWALGGANIAGTDYSTWVAGYATTTSVTLNTESQWNSDTVSVNITATQSDGGSTSYQGTLTVEGGVITSANVTQTG
jgi:hypothetical protein